LVITESGTICSISIIPYSALTHNVSSIYIVQQRRVTHCKSNASMLQLMRVVLCSSLKETRSSTLLSFCLHICYAVPEIPPYVPAINTKLSYCGVAVMHLHTSEIPTDSEPLLYSIMGFCFIKVAIWAGSDTTGISSPSFGSFG